MVERMSAAASMKECPGCGYTGRDAGDVRTHLGGRRIFCTRCCEQLSTNLEGMQIESKGLYNRTYSQLYFFTFELVSRIVVDFTKVLFQVKVCILEGNANCSFFTFV